MVLSFSASAQFYNGLQMSFGKNRVQYDDFYWLYYRLDKFDTYFYEDGKELAENVSKIADKKIKEIETFFEYSLSKRIIFIVYNTQSDFKQSNIGLVSEEDQYNIGGVTQIIGNKVMIFNEGNREKLEKQVSAAIAEVILNEMLYGAEFKEKVANSALLSLPEWFLKGLISYVSENWSIETENRVKDGILSGKYTKFNKLTGQDAVYAGHTLWNYIATKYGTSVIPNILYLTRVTKNAENGFSFVLGIPLKYLSIYWLDYYKNIFTGETDKKMLPEDGMMVRKPKKDVVYQSLKINPDDTLLAYSTNILGKYVVWLYNTNSHEQKRILRREYKLDQITDYSYPLIAWHPSGKLLSIITEEKGDILLYYYLVKEEQLEVRPIRGYDKILDFSYSDDGKQLLFSAIRKGQSDIFVYNLTGNTTTQITKDLADDLNPRFASNSKQIIFSSNRKSNILVEDSNEEPADNYDIFMYDYEKGSNTLTRISDSPFTNEYNPVEVSKHRYSFLSDENGIVNRYASQFDSTISFIDTTTHYRYLTRNHPVTNYSRNILEQDINKKSGKFSEIIYENGRYKMFVDSMKTDKSLPKDEFTNTSFRKYKTRQYLLADSLRQIKPETIQKETAEPDNIIQEENIAEPADTLIDINNYIFEKEKKRSTYNAEKSDTIKEEQELDLGRPNTYFTTFYTNYIVNQIDFGFLNSSYQAFTGGAIYYNPGLNLLFKVGTKDLFENYKITGGVRFAGNFDSNEYLLSFENLKDKVDKQFIFHRQAFKSSVGYDPTKTHTHELMYIRKYPFSQVASLKTTLSTRFDRTVFLSTDYYTLNMENTYKTWGGLKVEYIFDNTRNRGINLYHGTRFKVFGEAYKQINLQKSDLFVLGADFRYYHNIHRDLIWANRFAASTSFGSSRLIYYLGSVDNWINLSSNVETFNRDIAIDQNKNYAYQTLATNMRGFTQNIRNGNNFMVINSELRWPIIKYLSNQPVNSDFLANLQVIGFMDIGSAWSGKSPYDKENEYHRETIVQNPVTVIIDRQRPPFVVGYGFGVRTRLLGYFIRADWAWGIDNNIILPRIFYLSLSLDF